MSKIPPEYWGYASFLGANYKPKSEMTAEQIQSCEDVARKLVQLSRTTKKAFMREMGFLPSNSGYRVLCRILEKSNRNEEAVHVALEAKNEGWCGGWDAVINRAQRKVGRK